LTKFLKGNLFLIYYNFYNLDFRASRFRGWHQQDSHELLRYMIDGLRQEEVDAIARSVKEYLKENGKTDDAVGHLKLGLF
jgi:ubiquitin C-terminal hydrolase